MMGPFITAEQAQRAELLRQKNAKAAAEKAKTDAWKKAQGEKVGFANRRVGHFI